MHELGITRRLVELAVEHGDGARVRRIVVEIGELAAVLPDAVRFCFDVVSAGTAAEWSSIIRTVAASLPPAANSGQTSATGASRCSSPRSSSGWAQSAVAPLVDENTMASVSSAHAAPVSASARPPHRSTRRSSPT